MIFIQPSSGSAGTVSLGTDYETVGGSGLTLSSTNSAYDVVPYIQSRQFYFTWNTIS